MADVASALTTVETCQGILSALTALSLTAYKYPQSATIDDQAIYDFIVVGSGAGGSTVANRLSEDGTTTVALFECGGLPPLESRLSGLFTLEPNTAYDWNITSTDDEYAAQNLMDNIVQMTAAKMLGGSSCLDHMIYVRGSEYDYDKWAEITKDDSWTYASLMEYFIKSENCLASDILEAYPAYHGTGGPLGLTRETSDYNTDILAAFKELGNALVDDITANVTLGYTEPLLLIDGYRQSAAETYLSQAKDRSNLYVKMNSCVTKIIFDANNTATGVQVTTSDGSNITVYAKKEVIISGGAIHSPQLLMLSGIGPQTQLEELGIEVLANLPVGQNMSDHVSAVLVYALDESDETVVSNPHTFPVPMTTGYAALDTSQSYPDYQTINLFFTPSSSGLLQLCSWVFKYKSDICQAFYDANKGRNVLFVVHNMLHPVSRGQVTLTSTDPTVAPKVALGLYSDSDKTDLNNMAAYLQDFAAIVNTTYFKSVNSSLVDLNFTSCSDYEANSIDYWKCYALEMSSTMWHYSGTCAMGSVLESNLKVIGFDNLRVVDASSMPAIIGGNIIAPIYALAEKAAALIKEEWNLS